LVIEKIMSIMNDSTFLIIPNVFNEKERNALRQELSNYSWNLNNYSSNINGPHFWGKYPFNRVKFTKNSVICEELFKSRIEIATKLNIEIIRIHVNGQTHGQCGSWHTDAGCHEPSDTAFTLVYFPDKWLPEYGGHLLVKINDEVHSILPEFNKGVLFRTTTGHLGLEPSVHCSYMRESIACSFKVLQ
jgi:Rps23 Pro-64 3,4-dihydroxylase Tpa1-like proline 4-hydroxylase